MSGVLADRDRNSVEFLSSYWILALFTEAAEARGPPTLPKRCCLVNGKGIARANESHRDHRRASSFHEFLQVETVGLDDGVRGKLVKG